MGCDGSPELPPESDDNTLRTSDANMVNYGQSEESEEEDGNVYEGYEPLPLTDSSEEPNQFGTIEQDNSVNSNIPDIVNCDVEIERQIWSEPRPVELNIELDNIKTEQIITVMANFTLPNSAIPDWAQGVPEEDWKQSLLERIRQRKETS